MTPAGLALGRPPLARYGLPAASPGAGGPRALVGTIGAGQ